MIIASGNKLFYHVWPTECGKHNYEVDFLLSQSTMITPKNNRSSIYRPIGRSFFRGFIKFNQH